MQKYIEHSGEKLWVVRAERGAGGEQVAAIAQSLGLRDITAQCLYNRGFRDPEAALAFLRLENEMLGDPFRMADMEQAVGRIADALARGEKIAVYGDYDVDGVTASCTLYRYLRSQGGDVCAYIPNRAGEGYGVSRGAIETLAGQGVRLIVTVDTGITASDEVEFARTVGIDVVVTDHHECREELPGAVAVVNPHRPDCPYPFKELAGVGVVFKLICALEMRLHPGEDARTCVSRICAGYADLVAIGTIADVMPIRGENRLIVKLGLQQIAVTDQPGLSALMEMSASSRNDEKSKKKRPKITSGYIGYTLAPRINAAGRVRSAMLALDLFLTDDPARARELAEQLCEANRERQEEENRIMQSALEKIKTEQDFEHDPVIILDDDGWHHGVIGIVSSRLTERYGLPSILISFEGNDDPASPDAVGKGSGRSIKGMNLVDALVHCGDHLLKFGGHELAAGLSVRRADLPAFRRAMNEYARRVLTPDCLVATVEADCEVGIDEIDLRQAEEIRLLEPFGAGNPVPLFMIRSAELLECSPVSGGKHVRLMLRQGESVVQGMLFSRRAEELGLHPGDTVDVLCNIDINEWQGRRSVQLIVREIRAGAAAVADRAAERERFDAIWNGATFSPEEDVLPEREDFEQVYRMLRTSLRAGVDVLGMPAMIARLRAGSHPIGYIKLRFILRIFREMNLIGIEETEPDVFRISMEYRSGKADLEKSGVLRRLRSLARKS